MLKRRPVICTENGPHFIRKIGICTGGGQGYIDLAAAQSFDAFIHSAREQRIHFFTAGHHATERYGVKALGELLANEQGFEVEFKDMDNPA